MAEEVDRLGDKQMVLPSAVHEGVILRPVSRQGFDHLLRRLVDQCHGDIGLAEMAIHGRDRLEENLQDIKQSPNDPEPWCTSSIRTVLGKWAAIPSASPNSCSISILQSFIPNSNPTVASTH
jgi:hypothetical protein